MANVLHNALTGSELHEPKGIAAATAGQLLKADGAASGAWSLDFQKQLLQLCIPGAHLDDTETAATIRSDFYVPIPYGCTISKLSFTADLRSTSTALVSNTITAYNHAGTAMTGGAKTIVGSASGPQYGNLTVTANNTFTAGQVCKIIRTVGGSTNRYYDWNIYLHLTRTGN